MDEFSDDMTVEKAWRLLRKTQYLSDLDWDDEFSECPERHNDQEPAAFEVKEEKQITSADGCSSHSLQPQASDHLVQKETSTSVEMDPRRSSASVMESRISIHEASYVVKEEQDCIEIKEEPLSPLSSNSSLQGPIQDETLAEDILDSNIKTNRGTYIESNTASCLQIASSSSQSPLAEAMGMSSVLLQNLHCQPSFAMASCSTATGGYFSERPKEEQAAGERQKQEDGQGAGLRKRTHNSQTGSKRSANIEVTPPEREMLKFSISCLYGESMGKTIENCTWKEHFPSTFLLDNHMRVHTSERAYKCSHCDKSFSQKSHLDAHMPNHTGEKLYKCNQCEKSFNCRAHLQRHMHIHTGEKPFRCNQCDKSFYRTDKLTLHMRIHTGEKPYKCNQCEKLFLRNDHLTSHMRIHQGEKPYKCNQCEKSFNRRAHLHKHMHIHTGEKLFSLQSV